MEHTKGPWECLSAEFGEEGTIKFEVKMTEQVICKADANLIAAAPDLLEACKWLLFHAENGRRWKTVAHRGLDFTDDEFEGRLKTVITKAEGGIV